MLANFSGWSSGKLWRVTFGLAIFCCVGTTSGLTSAAPVCEESTATRHFLLDGNSEVVFTESIHRKMMESFDAWLVQHPDDVFVQLQRMRYADDKKEKDRLIAEYKAKLDAHPGDPTSEFFYAASLVDTNTPEAIERLKAIPADSAIEPIVHLKLEEIYEMGKFVDRDEARKQLAAYRDACPNSLSMLWQGRALSEVSSPEMAAKYAAQLRNRLAREDDLLWLTPWWKVWELDFIATPAAQQDAMRSRVDAEIHQVQKAIQSEQLEWLHVLRDGFHLADDKVSERAIQDLIVSKYPDTYSAKRILSDRWRDEHPYPKSDATQAETQAYYRAVIARSDEELKKNPKDADAMKSRFEAMVAIDKRKPGSSENYVFSTEEIVAAGERLRTALYRDVDWFSMPPTQIQIAQAYVDRGVRFDEVPVLIQEGRANAAKRDTVFVSDRFENTIPKSIKMEHEYLTMVSADLLVDAARQSGKPEMAKAAMEELAAQKIEEKGFQSRVWKVKAQWAELNGHKLDALLMYRASLDSRAPGYKMKPDEVDESKEG